MSAFNAERVIRAAIPDCDDSVIQHVIWGRTPYPFAPVTPRSLYRAASGLRRAGAKGVTLCDFCERIATEYWTCAICRAALDRASVSEEERL